MKSWKDEHKPYKFHYKNPLNLDTMEVQEEINAIMRTLNQMPKAAAERDRDKLAELQDDVSETLNILYDFYYDLMRD